MEWDCMVCFPPCTHLSSSGARYHAEKLRNGKQQMAIGFAKALWTMGHIPRVAMENPAGILSTEIGKPSQIVEPYMFGHPETKRTCLWLRGLPPLVPTKDVRDEVMALPANKRSRIMGMSPGPDRAKLRSKTYPGMAKAMAEQWGGFLMGEPSEGRLF